jgi:hypothetical protein
MLGVWMCRLGMRLGSRLAGRTSEAVRDGGLGVACATRGAWGEARAAPRPRDQAREASAETPAPRPERARARRQRRRPLVKGAVAPRLASRVGRCSYSSRAPASALPRFAGGWICTGGLHHLLSPERSRTIGGLGPIRLSPDPRVNPASRVLVTHRSCRAPRSPCEARALRIGLAPAGGGGIGRDRPGGRDDGGVGIAHDDQHVGQTERSHRGDPMNPRRSASRGRRPHAEEHHVQAAERQWEEALKGRPSLQRPTRARHPPVEFGAPRCVRPGRGG